MATARELYSRAAWTIGFALVLYYINFREYPGPAATLAAIIILIGICFAAGGYGLSWIAGAGQDQVRAQILDSVALQGSERVLDFGTGSGELGIAASQRLKSGRVIAIGETASNEIARAKAKAQGAAEKVRFESAALTKLSYPDANFDVVISSRVLNNLETVNDRSQAIREMARVLKPGGRIAIHEILDAEDYARMLTDQKLTVSVDRTTLPLGLGGRVISGTKPLSK
jgi:SAM-dependent methyltransferase